MTEEDAKALACCGPLQHPEGNVNGWVLCKGSACMAWRTNTRTEVRDKRDGRLAEKGAIYLRGSLEEVTVSDGGYCGLAGSPQ